MSCEMTTNVYTDGACSGNPGPGGWAWAVEDGPFACQRTHHESRKQFTTYVESETIVRSPSFARSASSTAMISIRWFVVCASAPEAKGPSSTAQAQPPGPGFPEHAPSV